MIMIPFSFLAPLSASAAVAQRSAAAKAAAAKAAPGWRGPDGICVSTAKLAEICGTPAGTPFTQEAAARVCFGKQS